MDRGHSTSEMKMANTKTNEKLLERLRESATRPYRDGEEERQRVSFIYSGLPENLSITKAQIREFIR